MHTFIFLVLIKNINGSVAPVTPPRPLRTGEQTAALWIAPYIDNQDVYHQPSSVFFVIKPSAWGKPRIN